MTAFTQYKEKVQEAGYTLDSELREFVMQIHMQKV
jgi:hypothetical protein